MSTFYLPPLVTAVPGAPERNYQASPTSTSSTKSTSTPSQSHHTTIPFSHSNPSHPHHTRSDSHSSTHSHLHSPIMSLKKDPRHSSFSTPLLTLPHPHTPPMHSITLPTPISGSNSPQLSRALHPGSSHYSLQSLTSDPRRLSSGSGTSTGSATSQPLSTAPAKPGFQTGTNAGLGLALGTSPIERSPKLAAPTKSAKASTSSKSTAPAHESALPPVPSPSALSLSFSARRKTPSSWDPHDDFLLRHLKEQRKLGWKEIALHFPNRTTNACQFRWRRLVSGTLRSAPASTKFGHHKFNHTTGPGPEFFPAHLAKDSGVSATSNIVATAPPPGSGSANRVVHELPHTSTPGIPYNYAFSGISDPLQLHKQRQSPSQEMMPQVPTTALPSLSAPSTSMVNVGYSRHPNQYQHHQVYQGTPTSTHTVVQPINIAQKPILPPLSRDSASVASHTTSTSYAMSEDGVGSTTAGGRSPVSPASSVGSFRSEDAHHYHQRLQWTADQDDLLMSRADLRPEELSLILGKPEKDINARIAQLRYKANTVDQRPLIHRNSSSSHFNGLHLPMPIARR